jgi:transcriptional regulator with XRE-family HTH domain
MNRLMFFRKRLGITASELARRAGAQQPEIWRLERWPEPGGRKMTREWADRLAKPLGVSPFQLLYSDLDEMMGDALPPAALPEKEFIERFLPVIADCAALLCGVFEIPVESPEAVAALAEGLARLLAKRGRAGPPSARDILRLRRALPPVPPGTTPVKPRPHR